MTSPTNPPNNPSQQLQITKPLYRGQSGTIHKGLWNGKSVVVKTFLPRSSEANDLDNFEKEILILKKCRPCPEIIHLLGYIYRGIINPIIITEYMENGSLMNVLANEKINLLWPRRMQIGLQTSRGLAHLHALGILHCDMKSPNILIDEAFNAKICDFGFSIIKSRRTPFLENARLQGRLNCTPPWVAPELLKNYRQEYTEACDIYSLGIVFWELATRTLPHKKARTIDDIKDHLLNKKIQELIPRTCPKDFALVIKRARAFDPQKRPPITSICEDLEEITLKNSTVNSNS